jgi:hypothetical protein
LTCQRNYVNGLPILGARAKGGRNMGIKAKGERIRVIAKVSSEKGSQLYRYTEEVANNTAQIVRVNSSGPFPVHGLPSKKGRLSTVIEEFRSKMDKEFNYPISTS